MVDPVTLETLLALPDDGVRHELQGGLLLSEPPTGFQHGDVTAEILVRLRTFAAREGSVRVVTDVFFVLARNPDTVRAPDVACLRPNHASALEDPSRPVPGAPALAVEVVSPSNAADAVHAKVADYLAAGTDVVWVVDPRDRRVTVYRELLSPRHLVGDDLLDAGDVLPGFSVRVRELFPE